MPNQNAGWIKIHRKILKWEWYGDPCVMALFVHILLTVNHEQGKWQGLTVEPGQKATTVRKLAEESGLTIQQTRTALSKLNSTNEITIKTTPNYSLIEVKKWNEYQSDNRPTNKRTTNEQHATQQTNNKPYIGTRASERREEERREEINTSPIGDAAGPVRGGDPYINELIDQFSETMGLDQWADSNKTRRKYAHLVRTSRKWTLAQTKAILTAAKSHPRFCNWCKMSDLYFQGVELIREMKNRMEKPTVAIIS